MKPTTFRPWPVALLLLSGATLSAALTTGGTAYTKKMETRLLAEPSALAAVAGKVGFGRALKVQEARGAWFRVADGAAAGWVFQGNLSETKPVEGDGLGHFGLSASATTATAAARPLTPAAENYATKRNLTNARDDLNWLLAQCHALTAAEVEAFLQEQKRGEYQ